MVDRFPHLPDYHYLVDRKARDNARFQDGLKWDRRRKEQHAAPRSASNDGGAMVVFVILGFIVVTAPFWVGLIV